MRLFVVDDHILFREGLVSIFESQPDFIVVGQAGSVREALDQIHNANPDLALIDLNLPDGDGLELTASLLAKNPNLAIVILTIFDSDELLFESIRIGAKGFILKNTPRVELLASLRALQRGEAALSRTMTRRFLDEFERMGKVQPQSAPVSVDALTDREMEVLRELGAGVSNHEIAANLCITENTVKSHIHNILTKLNLHSRTQASRFARRIGLAPARFTFLERDREGKG